MSEAHGGEALRKRVLVLCTGNSCRSQMAEGWIAHDLGSRWEVRSAGTRPAEQVHPMAIQAMAEAGVDISSGRPKTLEPFLKEGWDLVVTVCDSAQESCPHFPAAVEQLHLSFEDPARAEGSEAERLRVFRRVRDEIRERLLPELAKRSADRDAVTL